MSATDVTKTKSKPEGVPENPRDKIIYCTDGEDITAGKHMEYVYAICDLAGAAALFSQGVADGSIGSRTEDAGNFLIPALVLREIREIAQKMIL
jgi:hypothetical protein